MTNIYEEQVYDLAAEIRKEISCVTGEGITEWSGAFQIIMDIAHDYLSGCFVAARYNLHGINANLTFHQFQEGMNRAADRAGLTRKFDKQDHSHYDADYLNYIDTWKYYCNEE